MKKFIILVYISALADYVLGNPVAFITKCKASDTKCNIDSTQKAIPYFADGIPELDVKAMDPLKYKTLDATTEELQLVLTDATITGLKGCTAVNVQRDQAKMLVAVQCDGDLKGQYEIGGTMLGLPMDGKGAIEVVLKKILVTVEADLGYVESKDGKHWDVKSYTHKFELKDKAELKFENLFKSDPALGDAARDYIAKNTNDVVMQVGAPIIAAITSDIVTDIKHFFHKVPIKDLALD